MATPGKWKTCTSLTRCISSVRGERGKERGREGRREGGRTGKEWRREGSKGRRGLEERVLERRLLTVLSKKGVRRRASEERRIGSR